MAAAVQSNQPRVSADDANKSCINYRDLCVPRSRTQRRRPDRRIHRSIGRNCSPGFALALGRISEDDRGLQTSFAGMLETLRRSSQGRSMAVRSGGAFYFGQLPPIESCSAAR
jgi:hypothetical protein